MKKTSGRFGVRKPPAVSTPTVKERSSATETDLATNKPLDVQSVPIRAEDIRLQAYLKWEAAGRPDGNGENFWFEAERECNANRQK